MDNFFLLFCRSFFLGRLLTAGSEIFFFALQAALLALGLRDDVDDYLATIEAGLGVDAVSEMDSALGVCGKACGREAMMASAFACF